VIATVRGIIAFMNKSTYAQEHFDYQRRRLGIGRGLETIGETRFGMIFWSGKSVLRGLPAFKAIMSDETLCIHIPVRIHFKF
jgi:hypothetical protein